MNHNLNVRPPDANQTIYTNEAPAIHNELNARSTSADRPGLEPTATRIQESNLQEFRGRSNGPEFRGQHFEADQIWPEFRGQHFEAARKIGQSFVAATQGVWTHTRLRVHNLTYNTYKGREK